MIPINLANRRVLVTGGNSGIGESITDALSECGANVAINFLTDPVKAEAVAERARSRGRKALTIEADVSDPTAIETMFAAMDDAWGGIDILVNNAGIDGKSATGWEVDLDAWRKVIDVNLFGTFLCCRQALRRMVRQSSGVIINMSSVHETIPWSGFSAYASSKAGVSMLTKTLAQEAAAHGVRVLAVAPGAIKTPINQDVWSNAGGLADLDLKIPMGRMGEREEIARMVAVLASDLASYVTGTTVFIDGGMTDFADFAHGG